MIEVHDLNKNYGDKIALRSVSFSVNDGEIVGLIGKNGAGKSTILKSIAGLLDYDSGTIQYNGTDCKQSPGIYQNFGILIECAFLDYFSAYDNLKLLYELNGHTSKNDITRIIDDVFELVGLSNVKHKRVKSYSFGMRQRLGLAQAIINGHTFIMLDEPFIGLDPIGKDIVKKAILKKAKEEHFSVLFSSHDLDDVAEICDRIVMIDNGKCVYNDKPKSICEYNVYLDNNDVIQSILPSLLEITNINVTSSGFSFTDSEDESHLHTILEKVMSVAKIKRIEFSSNVLRNMFSEVAENEKNN